MVGMGLLGTTQPSLPSGYTRPGSPPTMLFDPVLLEGATRPQPSLGNQQACKIRVMPAPVHPQPLILQTQEALLLDPKTTHFFTWSWGVSPWSLYGSIFPDVENTWMASALTDGGQNLRMTSTVTV